MSEHRFLAFDHGAESGRAVVGTLADGRLSLEEIHRFPNEPVEVRGTLHWDILRLFGDMLKGMREYVRCYGPAVDAVGIDTWGVDFGLLGNDGRLLQNPVHYRDRRTEGMVEQVLAVLPEDEVFRATGLKLNPIHTLFQMMSLRPTGLLEDATRFLMIPDLLAHFLTGQTACDRTDAITTQLYDPHRNEWNRELFAALDLPLDIMPDLVEPGTVLGRVGESVQKATGIGPAPVVAPCTHDTAAAVAAVPGRGDDWAFLSSGTWSILGTLTDGIITSDEALAAGICNELTLGRPFICRNIMGLWLLQQSRAAWARAGQEHKYAELVDLAAAAPADGPIVHPDDPSFLAPDDMPEAIRAWCSRSGQTPPEGVGAVSRCIFDSLALCYRDTLAQLERLTGRTPATLHIVGGGSLNRLLCQLTADAAGIPVLAGPVEATVSGNILVQALALGVLDSPQAIRDVVRTSFDVTEYLPSPAVDWDARYERYQALLAP
jgi:rhamnulokinase